MMFLLGMSLMLNLVFIIGLIKCYKKLFKNPKKDLFSDMEKELDLAFSKLSKGKIVKENKEEDNNDLGSIFKTSADLNDFWK